MSRRTYEMFVRQLARPSQRPKEEPPLQHSGAWWMLAGGPLITILACMPFLPLH
jgi:hypothetical protein